MEQMSIHFLAFGQDKLNKTDDTYPLCRINLMGEGWARSARDLRDAGGRANVGLHWLCITDCFDQGSCG